MKISDTRGYRFLCFLLILFISGLPVYEADAGDKIRSGELLSSQNADPNHIVMSTDWIIWITYIYDGSGYISDLGWFLYRDAVDNKQNDDPDDDEFIGWENLLDKDQVLRSEGEKGIIHPVFVSIRDDNKDSSWEINKNRLGILDKSYGDPVKRTGEFPVDDETTLGDISKYNDGTGIPFTVNGDGIVTPHDMRKRLGTFPAGTELVFFITSNHRWYEKGKSDQTFFSKTDWNPDVYEMKWRYRIDRQACEAQTGCDADFSCFDKAGDGECIDNCLNKDSFCIRSCYSASDVADCGNIETECLKYGLCADKWIVFRRTVPLDTEIADSPEEPGWLNNWSREKYPYIFRTEYFIEYDKTKTYGGLVSSLETEMKSDSLLPVDPPADPPQFNRRYSVGTLGGESWRTDAGWLNTDTIQRLNDVFGLWFDEDDTRIITFTNGKKFPHVIAAIPKLDTDQWVMGWEDMPGTMWLDNDCNDLVFRLEIGDIHCGLSEAVQLLQILSGKVGVIPYCIPDIEGDGYMGLAEVVYVLQRIAGLGQK